MGRSRPGCRWVGGNRNSKSEIRNYNRESLFPPHLPLSPGRHGGDGGGPCRDVAVLHPVAVAGRKVQQGAETWTGERVDCTARSIGEHGVDGLRFGEPRGPGRRGSTTFVFDDAGREVMGREAPKDAAELARRVA